MAFLFWILIWSKVMNLHLHISIAHTPEIQTVWLQVAHSAFRTADSQHVPPPFYFLLEGGGNNNCKHRKGYNVASSDLAIPTIWQNITAGNLLNLVQRYS